MRAWQSELEMKTQPNQLIVFLVAGAELPELDASGLAASTDLDAKSKTKLPVFVVDVPSRLRAGLDAARASQHAIHGTKNIGPCWHLPSDHYIQRFTWQEL